MANIVKAMISSTARDLTEHRKAVMDACLSIDVFPSMMEYMAASDEDAVEASLRMVDGADIYIGIFANRYGYIPRGHAISITELEYQRAVERKIPILIFIMAEDHPPIPMSDETDPQAGLKLKTLKTNLQGKHVINKFRSPEDLRFNVIRSLWKSVPGHLPTDSQKDFERDFFREKNIYTESSSFSTAIKEQLALANKTIDKLTGDQYQIITMLRYQKRVAIAGCAGSGKTLIAVEKAIRLDQAGFRTLILCHSRYLAQYIQTLVAGTGITSMDFTTWVKRITGDKPDESSLWTHYEEPVDEELTGAFDKLMDSKERYDAILVDEGQDFREEWWLLVEAALVNQDYGILYIFHDDNQALLPSRSKYPIAHAPIVLSKNCRNAGAIFDIVRQYHPQSPEASVPLKSKGLARHWTFDAGDEAQTLSSVIRDALEILPAERIVVLTTEADPAEASIINNTEIDLPAKHRWQDWLLPYLMRFGNTPIELSDSPLPTNRDVKNVVSFAKLHYPRHWAKPENLRTDEYWRWEETDEGLTVKGKHRLAFFTFETWTEGLPTSRKILISSDAWSAQDSLRLYTVSSFKGLEADGVILFVPSPRVDLNPLAYVGISRAKLVLHIVTEKHTARNIPRAPAPTPES